jgi:FKBP-type peptidyl-prolyl cis-trans isomerase
MKKTILIGVLAALSNCNTIFAQVKIGSNKTTAKASVKNNLNPYKKLSNTVEYRIFNIGAGPLVKEGDFVRMNIVQLCGDSIIGSTYRDNKEPIINKLTRRNSPDDFSNATYKMKAGDSMVIRFNVDSILKKNKPPFYKRGDELKFLIKLESILNKTEEDSLMAELDNEKEFEKKKKEADKKLFLKELEDLIPIENKKIEDYCTANNIAFQKTKSGLYYSIIKNGTGNLITDSNKVTVNYDGYFIDGTKFDSNIDSAFNFTKPFVFKVGEGKVIKGWDEGMRFLNLGAKAVLLIPSRLAYGEKGYKKIVAPFSVLRYEVEVMGINEK